MSSVWKDAAEFLNQPYVSVTPPPQYASSCCTDLLPSIVQWERCVCDVLTIQFQLHVSFMIMQRVAVPRQASCSATGRGGAATRQFGNVQLLPLAAVSVGVASALSVRSLLPH